MEEPSLRIVRWLMRKPEVSHPRVYALLYFFLGCGNLILGYLSYLSYLNSVARAQFLEARLDIAVNTQAPFYLFLGLSVFGLGNITLAAVYAIPNRWPKTQLGLHVAFILLALVVFAIPIVSFTRV